MGRVSDAIARAGYDTMRLAGSQQDEPTDVGVSDRPEDGLPFVASVGGEFVFSEDSEFGSGKGGESVAGEDGEFVAGRYEAEEKDRAVYIANVLKPKAPQPVELLAPRQPVISMARARREAGSDEEVRIVDVFETLSRHLWLMGAIIVASIAWAVVFNYKAVPIFEARARLIIEPNSAEVVPFRGPSTEDQGRLDYYNTQIEVLRSRALARKTLERLQLLPTDPKGQVNQVSGLLGALGVAPVKSDLGESRVLNVTYRSPDPDLAARVVNGLAETYVDENLQVRRQGSLDAAELLNQRLAELRKDVKTSQGAIQQYREQKDSVSLGDQQNIVGQRLAQLNTAATAARMDRLDRQTLYEQLKRIQESGAPLDTFSPILSNVFIQGLKADLAGMQRERAQLAERLGDAHPDMIKINTSIAAAERRLSDEIAKIVEGIENDYVAAQAKEQAMTEALNRQKREVLALSQESIGFSALQHDAASTQQMFETVLQRVKETELSGGLQTNNAKILDRAEVPRSPIWPQKRVNLIIAALGGAFVAIGLAFTREYMNPRLARQHDIAAALGLPVLGTAPRIHQLKVLSALDALPPPFQEAIRAIRNRILLSPMTGAARALAVTSTNVGEGKTLIASNLAASMAMAGRRVLLVDADLRRPQLHRMFKIPKSPGLSDLLRGGVEPSEAVIESSVPGLHILAAGADVASAGDALDSQRLTPLIERFAELFDVVVLDCPPVMPVADAAIITNAAGSALFVVGSGTTSRSEAQVALERLASVQVHVVGVVLNKARLDSASAYHYRLPD